MSDVAASAARETKPSLSSAMVGARGVAATVSESTASGVGAVRRSLLLPFSNESPLYFFFY